MRATQEAAQRLAEEAAREQRGRAVPAAGWDVPRAAEEAHAELDAFVTLLGTLREVLPPELRAQLAELAKQLLVFVRSVLDWLIARLEGDAAPPPAAPVEDIPIS